MRILIFGGWFGSRNAGDEAILLGLRSLLENAFPGSTVYAHSIDPDYTREVCGVNPIAAPEGSFLRKAISLARDYRSMDLVVISGGTPIFDYRLMSRAFHFYVPILSRIPLVFAGIGLKPVTSRRGKAFYSGVLKRAAYVSVRDPEVAEHIRSMGFGGHLHLTADSAIMMNPAPAEVAKELLRSAGVDANRPIVAIAPIYLSDDYRGHYHEPVSRERRDNAYESLARVADHQIREGRQVIFLPMHQVPPDDDRVIIDDVMGRMHESGVRLDPPDDPRVVTALLHEADMLVGMRLHSLVLATSGGVPSVAIGFDMKVGGYMRYLGMGELCHPIDELSVDALLESSNHCWDDRVEIRRHLNERMGEWRATITAGMLRLANSVRR